MRKNFTLHLSAAALLTAVIFGVVQNGQAKTDGAPSGNTGSPDDGQTCANTGCHTGTALEREGLITSDVPAAGYLEGETYTISVTVSEPGISKFGFQASPQDDAGNTLGTMTLINTVETKLTGGGKYITHTEEGTPGSGSRTWTFNWTPDGTTGEVTFYTAVNASNGGDNASGDKIYFSSLKIIEDPSNNPVSITDISGFQSSIIQHGDQLHVQVSAAEQGDLFIVLSDLSGRTVGTYQYPAATGSYILEAEALTPAAYIATFMVNGKRSAHKFMVM